MYEYVYEVLEDNDLVTRGIFSTYEDAKTFLDSVYSVTRDRMLIYKTKLNDPGNWETVFDTGRE